MRISGVVIKEVVHDSNALLKWSRMEKLYKLHLMGTTTMIRLHFPSGTEVCEEVQRNVDAEAEGVSVHEANDRQSAPRIDREKIA